MTPPSEGTITVGLEEQVVEIGFNNQFSSDLVHFLFQDLSLQNSIPPKAKFDVVAAGNKPTLSLWQDDKRLYFGDSLYKLAYILINEVIYHCVRNNKTHLAIHAGSVCKDNQGVLFPGNSGAGKSSLTAWLTTKGCGYLSDELVLLSTSGRITPFTRPISFKASNLNLIPTITRPDHEHIIADDHGAMVPHRLLNADFSIVSPDTTLIIFPRFRQNHENHMQEISPAKSCKMLMESCVNARNFANIGIPTISRLTKNCRSHTLTFGQFEGLDEMILEKLSEN